MTTKAFYALFFITFTLSLIGIWYFHHKQEIPIYNISDISYSLVGEYIKTCGEVSDYFLYNKDNKKIHFLMLSDGTGNISVVFFSNLPNKDEILKTRYACVMGYVKVYKGKLEIVGKDAY